MNRYAKILLIFLFSSAVIHAQSLDEALAAAESKKEGLDKMRSEVVRQIEDIKLEMIRRDLKDIGLPGTNIIEHSGMILEYSEVHEQARWVAHIITPDIINGTHYRSNDFRIDPKVVTGSAQEADYFLKTPAPAKPGEFLYDGFGYDRGHLAPSADFRWSGKALSESYFYSNMSPQLADFNREGWAELESRLRGYVFAHPDTRLFVVTGGVLKDDLPRIERGVNKVAIPERFFKVVFNPKAKQAIGFLMPNTTLPYPIEHYAASVDDIEAVTGLDFFNRLADEDSIEASVDKAHWFDEVAGGDVEPVYPPTLPRGHFNTVQAKQHTGTNRSITVVGQVVSSRYSRSGNLWLNLDKKFPNQIFSVFIREKDLINFAGDPQEQFDGQLIAVQGEVQDFHGTPTLNLEREEHIKIFKN